MGQLAGCLWSSPRGNMAVPAHRARWRERRDRRREQREPRAEQRPLSTSRSSASTAVDTCPQEVKESFSGMKNLELCFYPLHTGVRYVGAPLELRRLTGAFSRGRPVPP